MITKLYSSEITSCHNVEVWAIIFIFCNPIFKWLWKVWKLSFFFVLSFHFHSFPLSLFNIQSTSEFPLIPTQQNGDQNHQNVYPTPFISSQWGFSFLSVQREKESKRPFFSLRRPERQSVLLSAPVKILAINNWRFRDHSDMSGFSTLLTNNRPNMPLWWLQACYLVVVVAGAGGGICFFFLKTVKPC